MDEKDKHWSMAMHGGGCKHVRNKDEATSELSSHHNDARRTWTNYSRSYLIFASIVIFGAATPYFMGQAHIIWNKYFRNF